MNIAFDVHGALDNDPKRILYEILISMWKSGNNIFIISGPPYEQIEDELTELGFDFSMIKIISVVNYLKYKDVKMWQDDKGDWWCDPEPWWASKGMICNEYKIDLIFDDKIEYKKFMPGRTKFILW